MVVFLLGLEEIAPLFFFILLSLCTLQVSSFENRAGLTAF